MVDDRGGARQDRWPSLLRNLSPRQLWRRVFVAVIAVAALFGGLDTVDRRITEAQTGKPFSDGQFTVTIDRASLVREITIGRKTVAAPEPGRRYLGVVAELRNDGTIPGTLINELELQEPRDAEFVSSRRMSDGEPVTSIGPGLTENLAFIWSLPEDVVPQSATLRISKKQFQELIVTYGQAYLGSDTEYTRVVVGVQVRS